QVVDLVGLPTRDGGGVKVCIFGIWLCPAECITDGLRVLRSEQYPHDFAAILVMLENLLTDELTFAIAVGGEPNPLGGTKGLANCFELGGFVAALCWASVVKTVRPQKYCRPAFPSRHNILWFEQVEQMPLGRQDSPVARTDGGADVFRLTAFLSDDDLIWHNGLVGRFDSISANIWNV